VIDAVLLGKDCLAVMRTGGGKFASYLAKTTKIYSEQNTKLCFVLKG
jgi:hypothetical protein